MYTVTKDGRKVCLSSDIQLTAFKKSGWVLLDEEVDDKQGLENETDDNQELEDKTDGVEETKEIADDMELLKAEATESGIDFHPNIGYEKLLERVKEFKKQTGDKE